MTEEGDSARHFTAAEANALLPTVATLVEALRDAQAAMEERQDEVTRSVPTNGGGAVHREFMDAATEATRALEQLQALGLVVRDPSSGLVDFPSHKDGEEVFLCWRLGEKAVEWWHPPETGFAGRQPI
ncbi:MAG: DUF2203 family protein [Actinomycetota bacterium]